MCELIEYDYCQTILFMLQFDVKIKMAYKTHPVYSKVKSPPKGSPCPLCGNFPLEENDEKFLVMHHWGSGPKLSAIKEGRCRWICNSCNIFLGYRFPAADYIDFYTWEEQREAIFQRARESPEKYPNFDGIEKPWSIVINPEDTIIEEKVGLSFDRTKKSLEKAMRVAQKEISNKDLRITVLNGLVDALEKVTGLEKRNLGGN